MRKNTNDGIKESTGWKRFSIFVLVICKEDYKGKLSVKLFIIVNMQIQKTILCLNKKTQSNIVEQFKRE